MPRTARTPDESGQHFSKFALLRHFLPLGFFLLLLLVTCIRCGLTQGQHSGQAVFAHRARSQFLLELFHDHSGVPDLFGLRRRRCRLGLFLAHVSFGFLK